MNTYSAMGKPLDHYMFRMLIPYIEPTKILIHSRQLAKLSNNKVYDHQDNTIFGIPFSVVDIERLEDSIEFLDGHGKVVGAIRGLSKSGPTRNET